MPEGEGQLQPPIEQGSNPTPSQEIRRPLSVEELRLRADSLSRYEEEISTKSERGLRWRNTFRALTLCAVGMLGAITPAYAGQATNPETMNPYQAYCEMKAGRPAPGYRMETQGYSGYGIMTESTAMVNEKTGERTIVRRQSGSSSHSSQDEVVCRPIKK